MAVVKVYHDGNEYDVQNDTSVQAIQFQGPIKDKRVYWRGYHINKYKNAISYSLYEVDVDTVDGYESPITRGYDDGVAWDSAYYTAGGNLKEVEIKMLGINRVFNERIQIEPMNLDGTVKVEYQGI